MILGLDDGVRSCRFLAGGTTREKEGFTERFEIFIHGMKAANGFSELNDKLNPNVRFEAQDEKRRSLAIWMPR